MLTFRGTFSFPRVDFHHTRTSFFMLEPPTLCVGWRRNLFLFLVNTLLLHPSLSPHRQMDRETNTLASEPFFQLCCCAEIKKSSSHLSGGCAIVITTGKKSSTVVVCLAGARSLLRPEKKVLVVIFTRN